MRIAAAAVLVSIMLSGEAYAAFAEGEAALNQKDFVAAFAMLKPDADAGNAQAQTYIGRMYRKGQGVAKDPLLAATWFQKAASQGEWEASNTLATMYRLGEGVPQDFQKAMQWYMEAAKLGVENAMYRVALMYQTGQGVQANAAEAYKWAYISTKHGGQPEPARLRDKLAKQLTTAVMEQAQRSGDQFLSNILATTEAKRQSALASKPTNIPVPTDVSGTNAVEKANCENTSVSAIVCSDSELKSLDEEVSQMYRSGLILLKGASRQTFIQDQKNWADSRNKICNADSSDRATCLKNLYAVRIEVLSASLENGTETSSNQPASPSLSEPVDTHPSKTTNTAELNQARPSISPQNQPATPSAAQPSTSEPPSKYMLSMQIENVDVFEDSCRIFWSLRNNSADLASTTTIDFVLYSRGKPVYTRSDMLENIPSGAKKTSSFIARDLSCTSLERFEANVSVCKVNQNYLRNCDSLVDGRSGSISYQATSRSNAGQDGTKSSNAEKAYTALTFCGRFFEASSAVVNDDAASSNARKVAALSYTHAYAAMKENGLKEKSRKELEEMDSEISSLIKSRDIGRIKQYRDLCIGMLQ